MANRRHRHHGDGPVHRGLGPGAPRVRAARRWCVERTFSWINRCRRTVRDYERLPQHHPAMIQWAMIALMTRRLAHHHT